MAKSIKFVIIVELVILLSLKGEGSTNWMDSLVKNVENDPHIHQVIILFDAEVIPTDSRFADLIKKLSSKIPVRKIVLQKSAHTMLTNLDFRVYNPSVTLFIITNRDIEYYPFDFLNELSGANRRPKCLLVLLHNLSNYRQFFKTLWTQQFLDVTIVTLRKIVGEFDWNDNRVIQYNPFSGMLTNKLATSSTVWFPDKMKNLHGYSLVVSLGPSPPDVYEYKNKSGVINYGLSVKKLRTLEDVMNFTLVKSSKTDWGKLNCLKTGTSGVLLALMKNEIQFVGIEGHLGLCGGKSIQFAKGIKRNYFAMVLPVVVKEDEQFLQIRWHLNKALLITILPFFMWIVSRLLHFQSRKWKIEYLFRMIVGAIVSEEPITVKERIAFAGFLIGCLMFSSEFFTMITDVQLSTKSSFRYENLKEVLESNLQICTSPNYHFMHKDIDDVVLQAVLKKAITEFTIEECLERLIAYKNLSCIVDMPKGKFLIRGKTDKCGLPLTRVIVEGFLSTRGTTLLGAGAPYARRIDQIVQRLIDSGIAIKWIKAYEDRKFVSARVGKSCIPRESNSNVMIRQMLQFPIIGIICSFLTFIVELVVNLLMKRN